MMNRKEALIKLADNAKGLKERESRIRGRFDVNKYDQYLGSLKSILTTYAWNALLNENRLSSCKDYLWLMGKCAIEEAKLSRNKNHRLFEASRTLLSKVALSDNPTLIHEYVNFDYEMNYTVQGEWRKINFSDWVLKGNDDVYHDAILALMGKDMQRLERDLDLMLNIVMKKKMNDWMKLDFSFFKAILNKDYLQVETTLNEILNKKNHKSRNRHEIYPDLLSFPALGYAKLAYINGLEIEIDSPYIPMELLNVQPLENYSNFEEKLLPTMYIGNGGDREDSNTSAFKKLLNKLKGK